MYIYNRDINKNKFCYPHLSLIIYYPSLYIKIIYFSQEHNILIFKNKVLYIYLLNNDIYLV